MCRRPEEARYQASWTCCKTCPSWHGMCSRAQTCDIVLTIRAPGRLSGRRRRPWCYGWLCASVSSASGYEADLACILSRLFECLWNPVGSQGIKWWVATRGMLTQGRVATFPLFTLD
jgi:hypothetical protein